MKHKINCVVKKREAYRPYAPAIAKELVPNYFPGFDITALDHVSHPLNYMASVVKVNSSVREKYPSAVHVDNTVRLQVIDKSIHPLAHEISMLLHEILDCGIILNTSFNLGYEALVCTPVDALNTISWSEFECAFMGGYGVDFA